MSIVLSVVFVGVSEVIMNILKLDSFFGLGWMLVLVELGGVLWMVIFFRDRDVCFYGDNGY